MASWGWRLPFLASLLLIAYGLHIRLRLDETAEYRAATVTKPLGGAPLGRLLRGHSDGLLAGSIAIMASNALVNLSDVFALAQAQSLGYDVDAMLAVQLAVWPLGIAALVIGATWTDYTSPGKTIFLGGWLGVPMGLAFGVGLGSGSLLVAAAAIAGVKCVGAFTIAAAARWMSELFPVGVRYSGIALAGCIGTTVGQALTPILAQMINASLGMAYIGVLPATLGLLALVAVRLMRSSSPHIESSMAATPG